MLKVKETGFFTTIQDMGRFGLRDKGVPVSGCMDKYSASMANSLLENEVTDAVMEITMTGPTLEFEAPTYIAVTGAEMSATKNGEAIANYEVHRISAGDILSFGKLHNGLRSYLAVKGGFTTDLILNSRSFYKPITKLNRIKKHMDIPYETSTAFAPMITHIKPEPFHKEHALDVFHGPEYKLLSDKQLEILFARNFTIAKENNRMAYQLKEFIGGHDYSMLTSATLPGTVQVTPAGKLILLMRDGQTTGGYPRILQLSNKAICILSQKKFGDEISFRLGH